MIDLYNKTLVGLGWSGIGQICRQLIGMMGLIFLARLLGPADFGLMGMVTVFVGFASLFGDLGLGASLIQKKDLKQEHSNSVFTINILMGFSLFILLFFTAPLVAFFYHQPCMTTLIRIAALIFIFESFKVVQISLLERQMRFQTIVCIEIIADLMGAMVAITMAILGLGVWSLIAQMLSISFIAVFLVWLYANYVPVLSLNQRAFKELSGFGFNLLGFNVFNYFVRNADNLLVGRYLGPMSLGIYSRAYWMMLLPIYQISGVLSRVMFPVFSTIQTDIALVKNTYLKMTRTIALISFPVMVGLFVLAKPFVLVLLGNKWGEVVPVLRILCVIGIMQSVGTTVGLIYTSQGRTDLQFKWGLLAAFVYVFSFMVGLKWGVIGVATAYVLSGYIILLYPSWTIPGRLINLSFIEIIRNLAPLFFASFLMGGALWFVESLLPDYWNIFESLTLCILAGVFIYWAIVAGFKLEAYLDFKEFIINLIVGLQKRSP